MAEAFINTLRRLHCQRRSGERPGRARADSRVVRRLQCRGAPLGARIQVTVTVPQRAKPVWPRRICFM